MNQMDLEQIVSLVTKQVMAAIEEKNQPSSPSTEGLSKVLVVGKPQAEIPADLCSDSVVYDIEDYRANRNILRYDRVIIAKLNITQLADLAQARIGDEVTCAVIHALLNGIETYMLDDALGYRKFAGKGSTALYNVLEKYAQTLQVFGMKMAGQRYRPQELPAPKPAKFAAPQPVAPKGSAVPNANRLVTEAQALELLKQGKEICLPADAILTPSARDVFSQAGVSLVRESCRGRGETL